MDSPVIERFEDAEAAATAAAVAIAGVLGEAVLQRGRASFIATGGRSPGPVYDRLARMDTPWDRVTVTLSDERWVDAGSADANARLVRARLLTARAAKARFVSLKTAHATPGEAVAEVEARLKPMLPADVTLLGMGEDGHVASLFPGGPIEAEGLVVGVETGAPQPRISLTLKALEPRSLIVLLISGEAKHAVLEDTHDKPVHALLARTRTPVRVLWSP